MRVTAQERRSTGLRRYAGRVLLPACVAVVVGGALTPATVVGRLREVVPGFAWLADALAAPVPWFNPLHVVTFALLACGWRLALPRHPWWGVVLALTAIGAGSEFLQGFVPGRAARPSDAACDLAGALLGVALIALARRWRVARQRRRGS